jgi:hypothetical protein
MLAGRPLEAVGNDSPRWMAVGPRERVHRTRPTGQLARRLGPDLWFPTHRGPRKEFAAEAYAVRIPDGLRDDATATIRHHDGTAVL